MIAKSSLDKDMKYLLTEMDKLIGILKVFSPLKGMFLADLKAFRSRETKTRSLSWRRLAALLPIGIITSKLLLENQKKKQKSAMKK